MDKKELSVKSMSFAKTLLITMAVCVATAASAQSASERAEQISILKREIEINRERINADLAAIKKARSEKRMNDVDAIEKRTYVALEKFQRDNEKLAALKSR